MKRTEFIDILRNKRYKYIDMQDECCVKETVNGKRIKYYIDMLYDYYEVEYLYAEYKEASLLNQNGYTVYKLRSAFNDIVYVRLNNKWLNK